MVKQKRHVMNIEPVSVTRDYDGILRAMVNERHRLGISQLALDDAAGLADGHTGKIENSVKTWGRNVGKTSLPLLLEALGLAVCIVRFDDYLPPGLTPVEPGPLPQLRPSTVRSRKNPSN